VPRVGGCDRAEGRGVRPCRGGGDAAGRPPLARRSAGRGGGQQ